MKLPYGSPTRRSCETRNTQNAGPGTLGIVNFAGTLPDTCAGIERTGVARADGEALRIANPFDPCSDVRRKLLPERALGAVAPAGG